MTTLTKTETTLLVDAAGRGSALAFPDAMKPATQQRHLGRFLRDGLISADDDGQALTPAGYRAVGLRPPRKRAASNAPEAGAPAAARGAKGELLRSLLEQADGATIAELMSATGWLPHTTWAALSRLRSAGTTLLKSAREDGTTAYRIVVEEPAPARRSRSRQAESAEAAAAA